MRWMLVALSAVLVGCGSQKTIPQVRTMGINAYAEGDYEAARAAYQEIVTRQPSGADDHYQLGRTLMALGRVRISEISPTGSGSKAISRRALAIFTNRS